MMPKERLSSFAYFNKNIHEVSLSLGEYFVKILSETSGNVVLRCRES